MVVSRYEECQTRVLYWVESDWQRAFETFGKEFGYVMVPAPDSLVQLVEGLISGTLRFHAVLGQEIPSLDPNLRDQFLYLEGRNLISVVEEFFHRISWFDDWQSSNLSMQIPSVLMRPYQGANYMTCGDFFATWPPLWQIVDLRIKEALQRVYGRGSSGGSTLRQDWTVGMGNLHHPFTIEAFREALPTITNAEKPYNVLLGWLARYPRK
ncbi:MAG: hypothetical protein WAP74_01375 [Patescibacteria group bacterium]